MTPYRWLPILAVLCVACSASPSINVGNEPDGSAAGAGGSAGFGGVGGFGGGNSLTAKVTEPPSEMAIEVVVISCAGECKQVLAVASGGNPGYTFEWNDGVTTAARELCADDDTTFTVTVRDTPSDDPEFHYEAQIVSVDVIAQVLVCVPDGGVPGDLCVENLALEGTPALNLVAGSFMLPGWTDCGVFGGADVCDAALAAVGGFIAPSEGTTAVYIGGAADGTGDLLSTELCAPIEADTRTSFLVDLWSKMPDGSSELGHVEIFGSDASCAKDELLWTSPTLSNTWQTLCVTLQATQSRAALTIVPHGLIAIDNIVPVAACP